MIRFVRLSLLVAAVALLLGPAVGEPAGPGAGEVERLIKQLGSEGYRDREAATKRLAEIGEPALPALEKAAASQDAEVRRRASKLVNLLQACIWDREARKIVERGVKALGGQERLSRYKGVKVRGKIIAYDKGRPGLTFTLEMIRRHPFQHRTTVESEVAPPQTFVWNGHKGWAIHGNSTADYASNGWRDVVHPDAVASLAPLLSDKGYILSPLGGTRVEGTEVLGVLVSHKDYRAVKLFFDKGTGLVAKYEASTEEGGEERAWEITLSDYRDFGGIKRPGKALIKVKGEVWWVWEFTEYEALEDVADRVFAEP